MKQFYGVQRMPHQGREQKPGQSVHSLHGAQAEVAQNPAGHRSSRQSMQVPTLWPVPLENRGCEAYSESDQHKSSKDTFFTTTLEISFLSVPSTLKTASAASMDK